MSDPIPSYITLCSPYDTFSIPDSTILSYFGLKSPPVYHTPLTSDKRLNHHPCINLLAISNTALFADSLLFRCISEALAALKRTANIGLNPSLVAKNVDGSPIEYRASAAVNAIMDLLYFLAASSSTR